MDHVPVPRSPETIRPPHRAVRGRSGPWYVLRVTRSLTSAARFVLAALCIPLLAGCAGTQDGPAASAARALLEAAHDGNGSAACDLLAPAARSELEQTSGKPCAEAVLEEDLGDGAGPARIEVFDTAAQVVVGADTVFLSRFDGNWLVIAAACTPVPGRPYDCSIGLP